MSEAVTSGVLAESLNDKIINEGFDIARSNRTGLLSVVKFGTPRRSFEGHKMSWLDMEVGAVSSTVTAAAAAGVLKIAVKEGAKFRRGMTLSVKGSSEILLVTGVSNNELTVKRGFGGTTAAAIAKDAVVTIDNIGREENSLAQNDGIVQPQDRENYFQTMDTAIEMSRRALATMQFGNTNDLAFQVSERIKQLAIQMDRSLIRGRKASEVVGGDKITYSGGLRYFLDQDGAITQDHQNGDLTLDVINDANAEIVARGGTSNTLVAGLPLARKISALVSANYSSKRLSEWVADAGSVLTLPSDLPLVGNVNRIVVDTNLDDDELFILDSGMVQIIPMASGNARDGGNWRTIDATQKGQDGERVRIIGDFAFEVRQSQTHMARIKNIKTGS